MILKIGRKYDFKNLPKNMISKIGLKIWFQKLAEKYDFKIGRKYDFKNWPKNMISKLAENMISKLAENMISKIGLKIWF